MGFNDHMADKEFNLVCLCPKCNKKFKVIQTEQIPGFRSPEDLVCPYCGHVLRTSMEWEFTSYEIE